MFGSDEEYQDHIRLTNESKRMRERSALAMTSKPTQGGSTPVPWRYEPETKTVRSVPSNYWIASMDSWDGAVTPFNDANAALIVKAVNERGMLIEALKDCLDALYNETAGASDTPWIKSVKDKARAALKQAEGGE